MPGRIVGMSRGTPTATRRCAWRSRRASSTSGATRPRATSARRRCCSRSWPACTPSTTAPTAARDRRARARLTGRSCAAGLAAASDRARRHEPRSSTRCASSPAAATPASRRPPPSAASTCADFADGTPRHRPRRDRHDATTTSTSCSPPSPRAVLKDFAAARSGRRASEAEARLPRRCARQRVPDAPGLPRYHSETRCCATCTPAVARPLADTSMIPLGSCTMKLNAAAEMLPVTWPEFGALHPFVPREQAAGLRRAVRRARGRGSRDHRLRRGLAAAQRRLAGRVRGHARDPRYHESRGEGHRNVCLIPSSAHGTNPASAVMAGMKVVVVKCDEARQHRRRRPRRQGREAQGRPRRLMVTYPSTHGVFEERSARSARSSTRTAGRCTSTAPT